MSIRPLVGGGSNRTGIWARTDSTPFGYRPSPAPDSPTGRSGLSLRAGANVTRFSPFHRPGGFAFPVADAGTLGLRFFATFSGVILMEATKIYAAPRCGRKANLADRRRNQGGPGGSRDA